jgi:hypothetical protein
MTQEYSSMPDCNDGNAVGILAERDRQSSEHHLAQPEPSADATATNSFVDELMRQYWAASAAVVTVLGLGGQVQSDIERALDAAYDIMCHTRPDPASGRKPPSSDTGDDTHSAGASRRSVAMLVRLISNDLLEPTTVEAWVRLLWVADRRQIAPRDFRRLVRAHEVGRQLVSASAADLRSEHPEAIFGPQG